MSTVLAGSHLPILAKLMERVDKPVLELGVGWNSTPFLHWMCKAKGLPLMSVESDRVWLKRFMDFNVGYHTLGYFDFNDWEKTNLNTINKKLGLVFIDHRPAKKRRSSARAFASRADYIVLHDSDLADHPAYKYTPIYNEFKYKFEYKDVGKPYTIVLSNFKELLWLKN